MKNRIRNFIKYFIDSRILVSVAAVCLYISTVRITQINFNPIYAIFLFTSTLATYNVPYLINNKLNRFRLLTGLLISCLLLISCFYAFRELSFHTLGVLLYLGLSTMLYYVPIGGLRLRNVPFLKIFIISINWALATVLLPIYTNNHIDQETPVYFLMLERFLFIFAITIPFDIRDMGSDQTSNLKTLPGLMGAKNALIMSSVVLLLYLVISFENYGNGYIFLSRLIVASIVLILLRHVRTGQQDYLYTGFLDGTMVLQGVFLWVLG